VIMKKIIYKQLLLLIVSIIFTFCFLFYYLPIRNVHLLIIIFVSFLFLSILNRIIKVTNYFKLLPLPKKFFSILFLTIFPVILMVSSKGSQEHLKDNNLLTIITTYFGTYLAILCILIWIISILLSIPSVSGERRVTKKKIFIYAMPSILVWFFYWIAFFPGGMTPDSLAQWEQAHTGELNNWHPVVYTWFIMLLTHIWDNPAIVTLSQIFIISLIIGYLSYLMEKYNYPKWMIWGISIIFALSPINSIYSIIIWKDVLYSSFLFLFSIFVLNIVRSQGEWLNHKSNIVIFIFGSLAVVFFRHNGFPVFIASIVVISIFYRNEIKKLLSILIFVTFVYLIVTKPIFNYLGVKPSDPNEALSIPTQQIATIISEDGYITDEQREYLNSIFPIELWKERFNPYKTDPIKFSWGEYNREIIFKDPKKYFKIWFEVCLQNPQLALKGFLKQTSLVWQINEPDDGYTDTFVTNVYYGNKFGIENKVINGKITWVANYILNISKDLSDVLWRPANYTYSILLLAFITYLKSDFRTFLIILPLVLNTGAVMLALPAQDFRYLFANTLVFYLSFITCFISFPKRGENYEKDD